MNKYTILITLLLFFTTWCIAQHESIQFQEITKWEEVLPKAKKENKIIFAYAYYPCTCCTHCVKMEKEIFSIDSIAQFYNKNFICVKLNLELPENRPVALQYPFPDNVLGHYFYPTLIYINPTREMVYRSIYSQPAESFLQDGKNALNPTKQIPVLAKKLENGIQDPNQLLVDLIILKKCVIDYQPYLANYFKKQPAENLQKEYNWNIIKEYSEDIQSLPFTYVIKNRSSFEKLYSKDSVESFIRKVGKKNIDLAIYKVAYRDKPNEYETIKKQISQWNTPLKKEMINYGDMKWHKYKQDWENYGKAAVIYSTYIQQENTELNQLAWDFYKHIDDKKLLIKAEEWSKHSVELDNKYANNDTYAHLLYKLGKKKEASKAAQKAIEIAKKTGEDYSTTEELLKK